MMFDALIVVAAVSLSPVPQEDVPQPPPLVLPQTGVCGELRPADKTFATELRADGSLWVRGDRVSFDQWGARLRLAAKAHPGRRLGGGAITLSDVDVVFRVDARVPSGSLFHLISECANPGVAAPRIFFAVRPEHGDGEAAFAMFLPVDVGGARTHAAISTMSVHMDAVTTAPSHPSQLYSEVVAVLQGVPKEHRGLVEVLFEGSGRVSVGAFLAAADAVARAGVTRGHFAIRPTRPQAAAWNLGRDIGAVVRAEKSADGGITFGGVRLAGEPIELPAAVRAKLGGFGRTGPEAAVVTVEEEEVVEVPAGRPGPEPAGAFDAGAFQSMVGLGGERPRFQTRGAERLKFAGEHPDRATAIDAGLKWLVARQSDAGQWNGTGGDDTAVTGLALLALLGQGNTMRVGPYRDAVKRGIRWLRNSQGPDGSFGASEPSVVPGHALATLAFIETYDVSEYKLLLRYSQHALDHLVAARRPDGGWGDGRDASTTTATAWAALALAAAEHAKLKVSVSSRSVCEWFENVLVGDTGRHRNDPKGVLAPRENAERLARFPLEHVETATAAALVARVFAAPAAERDADLLARIAALVQARPPVWNVDVGTIDGLYWLWASDALNQLGGASWERWSRAAEQAIVPQQVKNGTDAGSWDPVSAWADRGGRAWSTAVMVLVLQSPYRYARS